MNLVYTVCFQRASIAHPLTVTDSKLVIAMGMYCFKGLEFFIDEIVLLCICFIKLLNHFGTVVDILNANLFSLLAGND